MLKLALLLALLGLPGFARAQTEWTAEQKVYAGLFTAALVADYGQTRYVARTPGLYERNPLLGAHPSNGRINLYFPLVGVAAYLLADQCLEGDARTRFLQAATGAEVFIVGRNLKFGYRVSF